MTDFMRRTCTVVLLIGALLGSVLTAATKPNVGLASWYGRQHQGRKMANGHRFNRLFFTAAHRTYAFGTMLRVCLVRTGACADVEVTDRGPALRSRAIDLSEAAAKAIGLTSHGVGRVTIEEID
jgi:rare lipoprotein A